DVASRAVRIAILARMARRAPGGAHLEPAVLTEFLKADDAIDSAANRGSVTARTALQQVVAQAPAFSRGHSALALADALISRWDAPDQHDLLARTARDEAAKAMALVPTAASPTWRSIRWSLCPSGWSASGSWCRGCRSSPTTSA